MRRPLLSHRATAAAAAIVGAFLTSSCSDSSLAPSASTVARPHLRPDAAQVHAAIVVQERHTSELLKIPGVIGTAVGLTPNGTPTVRRLLATPDLGGLHTSTDRP